MLEKPLGVFDSGVGGLSVLREIRALLPHENILYLADALHLPYGTRPPDDIRHLTEAACRYLVAHGSKALVVACNTASTNALTHIRARLGVPIIGLVPAVKPAAEQTRTGVIGVLVTAATARSSSLHEVIARFAAPAGVSARVYAPPSLVEAVERGEADSPTTQNILAPRLADLRAHNGDTLVLGCTHFPFLRPTIARLDPDLRVIDSGAAIAKQTARILDIHRLRAPHTNTGSVRYLTTAPDVVHYQKLIAALLDLPPDVIDAMHVAI